MKVYRQGDVIIKERKVEELEEKHDGVLAEGEVTGHAHRIAQKNNARLYYTAVEGILALKVLAAMCVIQHEEHESVCIPEGDYSVEVQREYDWFTNAVRRVAD